MSDPVEVPAMRLTLALLLILVAAMVAANPTTAAHPVAMIELMKAL